jgi:hypothetical protein
MATLLYSCCDDVFKKCEVWRGPERIYQTQILNGSGETLAEASERRQRLVASMEETLASSFSCVRTSRKLMTEMDALKERLGRTDSLKDQAILPP